MKYKDSLQKEYMKTMQCSLWHTAVKMHFKTFELFFCGTSNLIKKKINLFCETLVITLDPFDAKVSCTA